MRLLMGCLMGYMQIPCNVKHGTLICRIFCNLSKLFPPHATHAYTTLATGQGAAGIHASTQPTYRKE